LNEKNIKSNEPYENVIKDKHVSIGQQMLTNNLIPSN